MDQLAQELYHFFKEKTEDLSDSWYKSLEKTDSVGVYSSTDPQQLKVLKEQNYQFHVNLCYVFIESDEVFFKRLHNWMIVVSKSQNHILTPIHYILREFFKTLDQYLELFDCFINDREGKSFLEILHWRQKVIRAFEKIIYWFSEDHYNNSISKLRSQQELINELSCPVIPIGNGKALLPLIGDIDTARAKIIIQNTLNECLKQDIEVLYVDLSGVSILDTTISRKLFQLLEALKMLGVTSILSGFRPELAQTAVKLGIDFGHIQINSKLELFQ